MDLNTLMGGLLTPAERLEVEERAERYKEKHQLRLQKKEDVLGTAVGRGLLFITMSIIRYSFYEDIRANFFKVMNLEDEYVEHSIKLEDTESEESGDEDIDEDDVTNLFPSKKIEQAKDSSDSESDS